MTTKPIYVTQPALPDLKDFIPYLEKIWENKILTNNGPFHQQFEKELAEFLGVKYISLFANGTLALLTALQALGITGEVITTPYSFVATTNCLVWNKLNPVFVDIEEEFCNLDPAKIEAAITPKTSAILPVHVYGNPCKVEQIQEIANKFGLKVIYDAAHAFGVNYKGQSICNFGDLSVLSFHATKVFNTMEGGAIVCHDIDSKKNIDNLKNFGFTGEITVTAPGINAKMNEMQAALGILQLKHYKSNSEKRKVIADLYKNKLANFPGIKIISNPIGMEDYNYSYFPILVDAEKFGKTRDEVYAHLKDQGIFARRYFFPLISKFPMYFELESAQKENILTAEKISSQVICLPIYPELSLSTVEIIVKIISEAKKNNRTRNS